jgi:capsid protein
VIGYLIDGEGEVPAEEVQHRKLGVDSNVKRGVPLFYPVQSNLDRAVKLLKNMSVVAQIQAAIAMIRKHSSTGNTVEDWSKNAADVQSTNQTTGKTTYYKRYAPGTILDGTKGIDYEFPSIGVDASNLVGVLQAELRSIASRLVMPEFMLTSDASNSNYASTMVAEGPAVKMFQRLQWDTIEDDLDVMDRVLDAAVANGRISEEARERVKIDVEPPRLENRERLEETQADEILVNGSAMSIATWQKRNDLDPDVETPLIDEDREKLDPFGGLDFGAGQPEQLPPGAGKPKEAE